MGDGVIGKDKCLVSLVAQAGIPWPPTFAMESLSLRLWIPTCAGMTKVRPVITPNLIRSDDKQRPPLKLLCITKLHAYNCGNNRGRDAPRRGETR